MSIHAAPAGPDRPAQWKSAGIKWHPQIRQALRARAAIEGVTMPQLLHRILVDALQQTGHVSRLTGEERPR